MSWIILLSHHQVFVISCNSGTAGAALIVSLQLTRGENQFYQEIGF
jgi:hypothetical protein